jgi:hypothetical protein
MAFLTDKEELKPGLVIFRRGDVQHRNWYCRVKLPKADRYKTISLKTADVSAARDRRREAGRNRAQIWPRPLIRARTTTPSTTLTATRAQAFSKIFRT